MDRRDFLKGGAAALALTIFGVTSAGKKISAPITVRMDILTEWSHALQISAKYKVEGKVFHYAHLVDEWDMKYFDAIKKQFEGTVGYAMNKSFGITNLEFKWEDLPANA